MITSGQEDGSAQEARVFDAASPFAEIMKEVIDYTGRHRRRFGDEPTAGSRADLESRNEGGRLSERRLFDIQATHQVAAGVSILSVGYLFSSLTQLYRSDMALFGFQVVARAVVENSIKAWWLVDPATSIDTRLARMYCHNLENINQMRKARMFDEKSGERRSKDLEKRAVSIGVEPLHDRKGKLIGFGTKAPPGVTEMAGQFFGALGYEHGEHWYRRLSAICHGTFYGLLDHLTMVDVPDSELKSLAPNLSIDEVLHVALLSTQSYLGAIEFDSRHMGWDHEDVARHRATFQEKMMAVIPMD